MRLIDGLDTASFIDIFNCNLNSFKWVSITLKILMIRCFLQHGQIVLQLLRYIQAVPQRKHFNHNLIYEFEFD